jgi:hypothetical protein
MDAMVLLLTTACAVGLGILLARWVVAGVLLAAFGRGPGRASIR